MATKHWRNFLRLDDLRGALCGLGHSKFERRAPGQQNAVDIFRGHWASSLTPLNPDLRAGEHVLFQTPVLIEAAKALGIASGRFDGMRILELGPLEGGHSYQLAKLGAGDVVAVESNIEAYLKCLIVKEIAEMKNVQFLLGDFLAYLRDNQKPFDLIFASGVLYHMENPLELISLVSANSDKCYFWTHYYDTNHPACRRHSKVQGSFDGYAADFYERAYRFAWAGQFWGGNTAKRAWLSRDAILSALGHFGFDQIKVIGETPDHPNGPAMSLVARKVS